MSTIVLPFNETSFPVTNMTQQYPDEKECSLFLFVIYVFIQGPMFVLGLIGNTLSFMVLRLDRERNAAIFLLQAMAMIDNLFLLAAGITQAFAALTQFPDLHSFGIVYNYLKGYLWTLIHITQLCSVHITVLMAWNRFIAICYPFKAMRICSLKRVKLEVAIMVIAVALYTFPRYFEHQMSCDHTPSYNNSSLNETESADHRGYCIGYVMVLTGLVSYFIPLGLIVRFNVATIIELYKTHHHRSTNRECRPSLIQENEERIERNNFTLVMLVIIAVFWVTQTPAYINLLLDFFFEEEDSCSHPYSYFYHISNLIVSSNSCLNFVVYCLCRPQFRNRLGDLRCCGKKCADCMSFIRPSRQSLSTESRFTDITSAPVILNSINDTGGEKSSD